MKISLSRLLTLFLVGISALPVMAMAVLILNISIIQLLLKALAEILQILRAQLGLFLQFVLGQPNGLFFARQLVNARHLFLSHA